MPLSRISLFVIAQPVLPETRFTPVTRPESDQVVAHDAAAAAGGGDACLAALGRAGVRERCRTRTQHIAFDQRARESVDPDTAVGARAAKAVDREARTTTLLAWISRPSASVPELLVISTSGPGTVDSASASTPTVPPVPSTTALVLPTLVVWVVPSMEVFAAVIAGSRVAG